MSPKSQPPPPEHFVPLRPVSFAILLVLAAGNLHGYGIMKRVNEHLGRAALLGPGTLYRTLKELRDLGLVTHAAPPAREREVDERRSYYALTPLGHRVAVLEATRIAGLMRDARLERLLHHGGRVR